MLALRGVSAPRLTQVAGPLLAFALLVIVAGAVNPAYLHSRDHVSNLASRGADQAWIGMLAIASFASAHAGAALLWRRVAPAVWIALLTCTVLGLLTTLARPVLAGLPTAHRPVGRTPRISGILTMAGFAALVVPRQPTRGQPVESEDLRS